MAAKAAYHETPFQPISGWIALLLVLANTLALIAVMVIGIRGAPYGWQPGLGWILWAIASFVLLLLLPGGLFIVNPNMSRVLVLFGRYRGTVREEGFHWTNPFTRRHVVSLRAHNQASDKIKVNDLAGNPIEIGTIVVWQVTDTAQA